MRIKSLNRPASKTYTFSFDNKGDLSAHNYNLVMSNGEIRTGAMLKKLDIPYPEGVVVKKVFFVGNRYYVLSSTNQLFLLKGEVWTQIAEVGDNPYIIDCSIGKNSLTAIGSDTNSLLVDGEGGVSVANLPKGSCAVMHCGRLFVASGNTLNFSKSLEVGDFSLGSDNGGFVFTDVEDGEIIALISNENVLVIFCEKTVYELIVGAKHEDFRLKRQDLSISVKKKSVGRVGDKVVFINNGRLCYYKNGNVKDIECKVLDEYYFDGQSTTSGNVYMAKIRKNSNRMKSLLHFDVSDFSSTSLTINGCELAEDGKFYDMNGFFQVTNNNDTKTDFYWESKIIDFEVSGKKDLLYFSAYSEGEVKVNILGDNVKRSFKLEKGYNERLLNIPAYGFTVSFSAEGRNFLVKDVKLKYRIRGERYGI